MRVYFFFGNSFYKYTYRQCTSFRRKKLKIFLATHLTEMRNSFGTARDLCCWYRLTPLDVNIIYSYTITSYKVHILQRVWPSSILSLHPYFMLNTRIFLYLLIRYLRQLTKVSCGKQIYLMRNFWFFCELQFGEFFWTYLWFKRTPSIY